MTGSFKDTVGHDYPLLCGIKVKTERGFILVISHPQRDGNERDRESDQFFVFLKRKKRRRRRNDDLVALDDAVLRFHRGRLPLHLQLGGRHCVDLDILRCHRGSWETKRGNNINTQPTFTTHDTTSRHRHAYRPVLTSENTLTLTSWKLRRIHRKKKKKKFHFSFISRWAEGCEN